MNIRQKVEYVGSKQSQKFHRAGDGHDNEIDIPKEIENGPGHLVRLERMREGSDVVVGTARRWRAVVGIRRFVVVGSKWDAGRRRVWLIAVRQLDDTAALLNVPVGDNASRA